MQIRDEAEIVGNSITERMKLINCLQFVQNGLQVFVIGSQFMQKLETCGVKGVQRWYQKVELPVGSYTI